VTATRPRGCAELSIREAAAAATVLLAEAAVDAGVLIGVLRADAASVVGEAICTTNALLRLTPDPAFVRIGQGWSAPAMCAIREMERFHIRAACFAAFNSAYSCARSRG
jgi:pyrroline-5-carboxylate reductase